MQLNSAENGFSKKHKPDQGNTMGRLFLIAAIVLLLIVGCVGAQTGTEAELAAYYQQKMIDKKNEHPMNFTPEQRQAAAEQAKDLGLRLDTKVAVTSLTRSAAGHVLDGAGVPVPGGDPDYFGPYPNYANSPMPKGSIASITVDAGGESYSATPTVTISDVYNTNTSLATATATVVGGVITNITVTSGGSDFTAPIVTITDPTGVDAAASAVLGGPFTGGIRKFVDSVPLLDPAGANNLGQYIPIAVKDTTSYPGSDYYEITLVEYSEKMHSDLPPTRLRGYVQLETPANAGTSKHIPLNYTDGSPILNSTGAWVYAYDKPHYLGPLIISTKGIPTRIKFTNYLPTGAGGDLFIPVDPTQMGAGLGPLGGSEYYTQNRGTIHLHGGFTPWISDGTPHQWITPAGEITSYPEGVSVRNVPDMDGGYEPPGTMTFYYSNEQSARLMFYHDHALGITRLNVYAGEAAGYLLTDPVEQALIDGTPTPYNPDGVAVLPGVGIPLIIQDRTFVDNTTIAAQDPTWNWGSKPGTSMTGDLWFPHVYVPAANPYNPDGVNPMGRWAYAPWFWPPGDIQFPPITNPYYDPVNAPWEPPVMPATPNPSGVTEAFVDTPLVNGAIYPNMTVEPKAYRFRILNAADDRFFNLQLYVADPNVTTLDGRINTEVKMVPAVRTAGFPAGWPTDGREEGVPDPATRGPSFIQIGTEGGFLPAPVVVPNQPVTWVTDPTVFNAGNVDKHALLIAPAERMDVIIDFSQYRGKTLILYNDAPAAFPARDPRYDYFTGSPDLTSTGGAPTTQAGYGPNTRTVMQIKVADTAPDAPYDINLLKSVFAKTGLKDGVFETAQDPIIVTQSGYNSAYNGDFSNNAFVRIFESSMNFTTLSGTQLNISFEPKAIHDEMGATFDTKYGRMSGTLGLEIPRSNNQIQNFMLYGFASPPVEILKDSMTPISEPAAGDGTQIWRITHNGVDTHPIHFHLFNVQLINRVGWDGIIRAPEPGELGWKETVRVSPLEDTIVALRPVAPPSVPFELPNAIREIDPTEADGATLMGPTGGFKDPSGTGVTVINHLINFGMEYVYHCHILSHEEMDMMHSMVLAIEPQHAPSGLIAGWVGDPANPDPLVNTSPRVNLAWHDNTISETNWSIQRYNYTYDNWTEIALAPSTTGERTDWAMYTDTSVEEKVSYKYRVNATNVVGDITEYPAPSIGFPTMRLNSTESNEAVPDVNSPPVADFTGTPETGVTPLTVVFTDGSSNGPTAWLWDFGDGNITNATMQHPVHTYSTAGTYTVSLIAYNVYGSGTATRTDYITVTDPAAPVVAFTGTPLTGNAPLTVAFTDGSSNTPTSWTWDFGDGGISNIHLQNPMHTYMSGGTYSVTLTAANAGGSGFLTKTGYITVASPPPVADFSGTPLTGNAPLTVVFTDLSANAPTSWAWDFGDGNITNATDQHPVHSYLNGGNFTVALTATNGAGSDTMTKTGYVNVTGRGLYGVGVFRPSTHTFILKNGSARTTADWGVSTDLPVAGDWNGDRLWDIGVFRNTTHTFILKNGTARTLISWGKSTDIPLSADWNGDGLGDVGVFRPSAATFILKNGSARTLIGWGRSTDIPVAGDWNGDGLGDIGVFRPSTVSFILKNGSARTVVGWGRSTDIPIAGDWNGDGLGDVGVFRNITNTFILKNGTARTLIGWGQSTDLPVSGIWTAP
jgi:PKD repeat protein/FtsP/CotA-like multicopper oxidase with cupredoxin domain